MNGRQNTVLTVRFLCELGMLAALAYWGFDAADGVIAWVLGLGAPLVAIAVWGAFVAPKAARPVTTPVRLAIELVLFGAAAAGLIASGQAVAAIVLGLAAGVTSALNAATGDESPTRPAAP